MKSISAFAILGLAQANDNGLALTPPLGWRSWNLYGANVNQSLITGIMDGMVKKQGKTHLGDSVSLSDLGFNDVGLDDNWQACGSPKAAPGMHYHDVNGAPIVNLERFPDFKAMTSHAHSLKLTSGWYGNNCICSDHCKNKTECDTQIENDVKAMSSYNFDSWKLDGCGAETDLVTFNKFMQQAGKPIMVENCHWGSKYPFKPDRSLPPAEGCPWNFYRSSGDVRASYASILRNLGTTVPLAANNLSYPGCWAYPDMLQVGCEHGPGGKSDPGLTPAETRTHYGAWSIVSSPLTLSHDVNDAKVTAAIWDVISNTEALAVNQAYFGHSGTQVPASVSADTVTLTDAVIEACIAGTADCKLAEDKVRFESPSSQAFYKPLSWDGSKTAVLLMNSADATGTVSLKLSDIPGFKGTAATVRDIWGHKDLGVMKGSVSASVDSHDAAFMVLTASTDDM
jgi:alpha-galactosidase